MTVIHVSAERCVGCGLCCKACPTGAMAVHNARVVVDHDRCTLCRLCIGECPVGALAVEEPEQKTDTSQHRDVWVFAEQSAGRILPVAYELLGKGRELAQSRRCGLVALLLGPDEAGKGAASLFAHGARRVIACSDDRFAQALEDPFADLIAALAKEEKPEILLFGATGFGRSLAPRVAARLGTGLTADCTGLEICPENGWLRQIRPAFGGNLMATIATKGHRPQMATVRPGVFPVPAPCEGASGEILQVAPPETAQRVTLLHRQAMDSGKSIADAPVIVTAGMGIGSPKNLALVEELAKRLGGAMGVTRPLVDVGWAEYRRQIGQTGLSVAPRLLICCGVSGAIQHLAGIGGAKTIVAINTDQEAPILSVANYKLVGDCVEILKHLLATLKQRPKSSAFPQMMDY